MYATWLVTSLLIGELLLFGILKLARRGDPTDRGPGLLYHLCCLGLFAQATASVGAYRDTGRKIETAARVSARFTSVRDLLGGLKDMETGERGFLVTGEDRYLGPYRENLELYPGRCAAVRAAYLRSEDEDRAENLCKLAVIRVGELRRTLDLYDRGGREKAAAFMRTDLGRSTMETFRIAADDLMRRNFGHYDRIMRDLYSTARARIAMASLVALAALASMATGTYSVRLSAIERRVRARDESA